MADEKKSNLPTKNVDKTSNYFNNLGRDNAGVSVTLSENVINWFQSRTGSRDSAVLLANALVSTAESLNENPMTVINKLRSLQGDELAAMLSFYLNTNRIPTSLLGLKHPKKTVDYVQRTIIF